MCIFIAQPKEKTLREESQINNLLSACKRQDQKAQLEIYNRYCKAMYNIALRIIGDPDDAEDVMQEAFIKAFANLHRFAQKSTFGAWLKRIVINESISWLRKNTKMQTVPIDERLSGQLETDTFEIPNDADVKMLLQAVSELKENYRVAISLLYFEGYDYEEISEIMHLSYGNVRTLVSRAKQKLKQIILEKMNTYS